VTGKDEFLALQRQHDAVDDLRTLGLRLVSLLEAMKREANASIQAGRKVSGPAEVRFQMTVEQAIALCTAAQQLGQAELIELSARFHGALQPGTSRPS